MSEIYDATYQAIRSRVGSADIGDSVQSAIRDLNLSFYAERAVCAAQEAAAEHARPSAVYRPALSLDGNSWCALYGANIQDGVAGFGASPAQAMAAFDAAWVAALKEITDG